MKNGGVMSNWIVSDQVYRKRNLLYFFGWLKTSLERRRMNIKDVFYFRVWDTNHWKSIQIFTETMVGLKLKIAWISFNVKPSGAKKEPFLLNTFGGSIDIIRIVTALCV